jgi:hypothetical protein
MASFVYPTSLVMRRTICFYCPREFVADHHVLGHNHGIRYCEEHQQNALQDGRAFMHESGYVRIADAREVPTLRTIIDMLSVPVCILRTNGKIHHGWTFYYGSHSNLQFIQRINGFWSFPMIHESGILKHVVLDSFHLPQLKYQNDSVLHSEFYEFLDKGIAILDKGIYEADRKMQLNNTEAVRGDSSPLSNPP